MKNAAARGTIALLLVAALSGCGGDDGSTTDVGVEDGAFSLATSVTLMQLCLESYQMLTDFENGATFTLPAPYTLQAQYETEEHYTGEGLDGEVPIAFIATSGSSIYVVFRGTKTISEWISDADQTQRDYTYVSGGGKTETGFTDIYATLREPILTEVAALAASGSYTTLYITGHSLGAALATLAAPDIAANTSFTNPTVYTFASPRPGDPSFASLVDDSISNSWRIANTFDEVPKLPDTVTVIIGPAPDFKRTFYFYEHVNTEYEITFGGPIHSFDQLVFNHSSCNYFATLCDQSNNPGQCKAKGQGLNGCNFS